MNHGVVQVVERRLEGANGPLRRRHLFEDRPQGALQDDGSKPMASVWRKDEAQEVRVAQLGAHAAERFKEVEPAQPCVELVEVAIVEELSH